MALRIGIDIGSITVKVVVLDEQNQLLFRSYERHYSKTRERTCETLQGLTGLLGGQEVQLLITGSAGLGVARPLGWTLSRRSTPPPLPSVPSSPRRTLSSSWGGRMPRSSSSATPWRSG